MSEPAAPTAPLQHPLPIDHCHLFLLNPPLSSFGISHCPPQKDPNEALVIAVTTRAIFNLEEEHQLFLTKGKEEYVKYQQVNEDKPLEQGTAFAFIQVRCQQWPPFPSSLVLFGWGISL